MDRWRIISLPFWFLTTLFAIPPAAWSVLFIRHRRRPLPGHCRRCGYNLTGNQSGICPECGTLIPAETINRLARQED